MGLANCKVFFWKNQKDSAKESEKPDQIENGYNGEMVEVMAPSNLLVTPFAATSRISLQSVGSAKSKISVFNEQPDYIEEVICSESDISDNEMKEFNFRQDDIVLLIKQNNKYYGLDFRCADCGASLKNGVLESGRIRCPIYGTCYNFKGEIEQFPGIDPILAYEIKAQKGFVKLRAKKSLLEQQKIQKSMAKRDQKNEKNFVLIGSGYSIATCLEYLRHQFTGRIIVISEEHYLPYDLQKLPMMDSTIEDLQLRSPEFYETNSIEMILNTKIQKLDTKSKQIVLNDNDKIEYNKLFLAPGSATKKSPDLDFKNVLVLDNYNDVLEIQMYLKDVKNVIIYGSDYRGLEIACYCSKNSKKVTILEENPSVLKGIYGYDVSNRILEYLEENKIEVILEAKIKKHSGNLENVLESIELEDGRTIYVELMILSLETMPETSFLKDSGINLNEDKTITTNQYLQTNLPDIYSTGFFKNLGHSGIHQHYGKAAALNMLGKKTDSKTVPYFWFEVFGKFFTFVGDHNFDSLLVEGDLQEMKFDVFYFDQDENLRGILSCRPNNFALEFAEILMDEKKFGVEELEKKLGKPIKLLKKYLDGDLIEATICKESDIGDNEINEFEIEDYGKLLLINLNGQLSAIGTSCSHCGSRLVNMALGERRIRCSSFGTSFCFQTDESYAEIEEFPGVDCIPAYKVRVEDDWVKVQVRKSLLKTDRVTRSLMKRDLKNDKTFVVIGGGASACTFVEILRQHFTGKIVMLSKDEFLPYDRTNFIKLMDSKIEDLLLRSPEFYESNSIEISLNSEVSGLDAKSRQITLSDGKKVKYDKLFMAPGASPKKIPGVDFKNVFTLGNFKEAQTIKSILSKEKHMVILGLSYVSLELAAYCVDKVAKITIVGKDSVPFKLPFGEKVGAKIKQIFEEKGVEFKFENGIGQYFADNKGYIRSVELIKGESLVCDILVMGIGLLPNTNFLKDSGVTVNKSGSITTNQNLQTNIPEVFAGGEIANTPQFFSKYDIGHSGIPQYHGKMAALNMLGIKTDLKVIPYFWMEFFGHRFTYAGDVNYHSLHVEGNLESLKFVAFYFNKQNFVVAVCSCQPDLVIAQYAEMLADDQVLKKEDLELHYDNESD